MKLLEKITNFFSGVSLELDHETESQLMDYLLEGVGGLNQINISDLDKNEIIKWKLREFKKFLKYGDGFEKKNDYIDFRNNIIRNLKHDKINNFILTQKGADRLSYLFIDYVKQWWNKEIKYLI